MTHIQDLEQQNKKLAAKLKNAQQWMSAQVESDMRSMSSQKTVWDHNNKQNIDIIQQKISDFLGDIVVMNIPEWVLQSMISAELEYSYLQQDPHFDGLWIISSYHKAIDLLIESYITRGFRSMIADDSSHPSKQDHDALETSLGLVIAKKYSLSIGRFYHLLHMITTQQTLWYYGNKFADYLTENHDIWKRVLSPDCIQVLQVLVESELVWRKRHEGSIGFDEVTQARKYLIWNLEDHNCLIYKLLEIGKIDF